MNSNLLYILLNIIPLINCTKHCKNIVKFGGKFYEKEFLADGTVSKPFCMTYLEKSDRIIFSEDSEPFGNTNTMVLDIKTKKLNHIDIDNIVVNGVHNNGTIFIGKEGGLFKLDEDMMTLSETAIQDVILYSMIIRGDQIYFTDYPKKDLYEYDKGEIELLLGDLNINDFAIDNDDNVYYFNKTGIYVLFVSDVRVVKIHALAYEEVPLNGLVFDDFSKTVYATSVYGVFRVDIDNNALVRTSMKMMFDIIFDKNGNIIYADEESIVRLKLSDAKC